MTTKTKTTKTEDNDSRAYCKYSTSKEEAHGDLEDQVDPRKD